MRTDTEGVNAQWRTIRALERDLEDAMARGNRISDGLGFAAVAHILQSRGWTKPGVDAPPAPKAAEWDPALHDVVVRILAEDGLVLQDVMDRDTSARVDAARRRVCTALVARGLSIPYVAALLHRDRSTVYMAVHGR